jgi:GTP diphosphokinase / guanosine-3',5'-bis(diphosphate) 3'-diphosphatase
LARYPYRVVVARWTKSKNIPSFITSIKITGFYDIGIINKITDIISGQKADIKNFSYNINDGMFEGTLSLMVANNNVLQGILRRIQALKGVLKAVRQDFN